MWRLSSEDFIPYPCLHPFEEGGGVVLEEIEMHGFGDAEDEVAVQGRLVENLVDMVARASNLAGQPAGAALVGLELSLDEIPDVDAALCLHKIQCILWGQK